MRRYNGNTGRYEYIPDGVSPSTARYGQGTERGAPLGNGQGTGRGAPLGDGRPPFVGDGDSPSRKRTPPSKDILGSLQSTLSNLFSKGFENEDLLLFAVLFLMYQETGDKELLIIMGGMFLL